MQRRFESCHLCQSESLLRLLSLVLAIPRENDSHSFDAKRWGSYRNRIRLSLSLNVVHKERSTPQNHAVPKASSLTRWGFSFDSREPSLKAPTARWAWRTSVDIPLGDCFTVLHDPYHVINLINDGAEAPENIEGYKPILRRMNNGRCSAGSKYPRRNPGSGI